jgi:hypothetical protein
MKGSKTEENLKAAFVGESQAYLEICGDPATVKALAADFA